MSTWAEPWMRGGLPAPTPRPDFCLHLGHSLLESLQPHCTHPPHQQPWTSRTTPQGLCQSLLADNRSVGSSHPKQSGGGAAVCTSVAPHGLGASGTVEAGWAKAAWGVPVSWVRARDHHATPRGVPEVGLGTTGSRHEGGSWLGAGHRVGCKKVQWANWKSGFQVL